MVTRTENEWEKFYLKMDLTDNVKQQSSKLDKNNIHRKVQNLEGEGEFIMSDRLLPTMTLTFRPG